MEDSSEMDISTTSKNEVIDEGLYSRQLYVMGHEAQKRMAQSDVLIVGLDGLGVETAKNIVLAGVKSVTLHDDCLASLNDLSSQFYITESDIGLSRARATIPKLSELNPYVPITILEGEITPSALKNFSVVVLIGASFEQQLQLSSYCHANKIAVVVSEVRGVFGNIFCDFGENFVVNDTNGEAAASSMIASISAVDHTVSGLPTIPYVFLPPIKHSHWNKGGSPRLLVTVLEDGPHNLSSGDIIELSHVVGAAEINGMQLEVTVKDRYSFEIPLQNSLWSLPPGVQYLRGGYVKQIKQPQTIHFSPLSAMLDTPGYVQALITKEGDRALALHLAFRYPSQEHLIPHLSCQIDYFLPPLPPHDFYRCLHEFITLHGSLPIPGSLAHADILLDLTKALNQRLALV
jgi:ubiquitin-activating enzyme E1